MKDDEALTLNRFFSAEQKLSGKKLAQTASQENVGALKNRLSREVKILWPVTCRFLFKKLMEALDIKLPDAMVATWKKYREIVKYKDEQKSSPDETHLVSLFEHTIEAVYTPYLEITINNQPVGRINFEIKLSLKVDGIRLEIKNGKIMRIHTGSCRGGGSIKCEGISLIKRETKPFTLPGIISLGKGVAIADNT